MAKAANLRSALLLTIALLAGVALSSAAFVGPVQNPKGVADYCKNTNDGFHCYFPDSSKYVRCLKGKGYLRSCPRGKLFDYAIKDCVDAKTATVCPAWPCPLEVPDAVGAGPNAPLPAGFAYISPLGLANPRPSFQTGNFTFTVSDYLLPEVGAGQKGEFHVICPFGGHCSMGMNFKVSCTRLKMGQMPMTPKVHVVDFEETVTNDQKRVKPLPDLNVACNDIISVVWDEPVHNAAIVYPEKFAKTMPMAWGPAAPSYKCPVLKTSMSGQPLSEPGVTVYPISSVSNDTAGIFGNTVVGPLTKAETFYFFCSAESHCRLGMVFKVTVKPAPKSYKPKTININWVMTWAPYKDMEVYVGDTFAFKWAIATHKVPDGKGGLMTVPNEFDSGYHGVARANSLSKF